MDKVVLDAYIFFQGECKQAMEFYRGIFGGKLDIMWYDDMPAGDKPANSDGKIMNSMLTGGDVRIMAADSTRKEKFGESFISLSLNGSDEEKLRGYFEKLSAGGKVEMPLKKEFWGGTSGMLTDKFGVDWMVNIMDREI